VEGIRAWVLATVVVLTASACAGATSSAAPTDASAPAQRAQSPDAPAGLAQRSCPTLPDGPRLDALPDDVLACLGDGAARAADRGDDRPTVVNLWASWCAPCVREMPALQELFQRNNGAVRFVGIDTEDARDSAAGLLEFTGVTYEQRDDPDAVVRAALRAPGLPVTLVYAAGGREVARRFGEVDARWLQDALIQAGAPGTQPAAGPAPAPGQG